MNGGRLNHLRFADDIVLVTDRIDWRMNDASETSDLKINFS